MKNTRLRRYISTLIAAVVALSAISCYVYANESAGLFDKEYTDEALFCLDESAGISDPEDEVSEEGMTLIMEDSISDEDALPDNDELLEGYIREKTEEAVNAGEPGNDRVARRENLSEVNKVIYDGLAEYVRKVADGDMASTAFPRITVDPELCITDGTKGYYTARELGVPDVSEYTSGVALAYLEKIGFEIVDVHTAILADMPYDLYWYDKTAGISYSTGSAAVIITEDGEKKIKLVLQVGIKMFVSSAYSATDEKKTTAVNTVKTRSASSAVTNAQAVVDSNASLSDYAKLKAYNDWICANVDYNYSAAKGGVDFGDPWQLIYVFDDDSKTKVVCEGYSKAFKLLCDLSDFDDPDIDCYLPIGTMNGGNHMWNTVLMDDGRYYLVDVTNCDKGAIGYPYKLFLAGFSGEVGSVDMSFYITCGSKKMTYKYDDMRLKLYSKAERSISGSNYDPDNVSPKPSPTPTPTPKPTKAPTPTPTPTPGPTKAPTATPMPTPTPGPTKTPTTIPTPGPTSVPEPGSVRSLADQARVKIECGSAMYSKAGAFPKVKVMFDGEVLKEGFDYTLTYSNNKKVADEDSANPPTVYIKGIGDYTDKAIRTFNIEKADKSRIRLVAADKVFKNKADNYKVTPKLRESGKTLSKGKDVSRFTKKDFRYYYAESGLEILDKETVPNNTEIEVRLTVEFPETSSFEAGIETFTTRYRLISSDANIKKASVKVASPDGCISYVSGEDIEIKPEDLTVTFGGRILDPDDYMISSVVINAKKTSAKITVSGLGAFGGSKNKTVKLKALKE